MNPGLLPSIPNPPPPPNSENYPGYDQPGYFRLMGSLSETDRKCVEASFKSVTQNQLSAFVDVIKEGRFHKFRKEEEMYTNNVMALLALQKGLLSVNQVATMLFCDAAVTTLISHKLSYFHFQRVENGKDIRSTTVSEGSFCQSDPSEIRYESYKYLGLGNDVSKDKVVTIFGEEFCKPILQRFFGFSDILWRKFCEKLESEEISDSERFFYINTIPKFGCWSGIVSEINEVLSKILQPQFLISQLDSGKLLKEKVMITPSFSMYQLFLDVLSTFCSLRKIKLVPTYGLSGQNFYTNLKVAGQVAVSLYFPEKKSWLAYDFENPDFKVKVDGWVREGTLAVIIHDIYHSIRELWFTESCSIMRFFFAEIARALGDEQTCYQLIDGEVLTQSQASIGNIFNTIKPEERVKNAMIQFMVDEALTLGRDYNIGRNDLEESDRKLYDKLYLESVERSSGVISELENYEPINIKKAACYQIKGNDEVLKGKTVKDPFSKVWFDVETEKGLLSETLGFYVVHKDSGLESSLVEVKLDGRCTSSVFFNPTTFDTKYEGEKCVWPNGEHFFHICSSSGVLVTYSFNVISSWSLETVEGEMKLSFTPD
ncbi:MAG: hypothetical protein VX777_04585 [Chlamydiota bacterium]|nr:hypothetical protein [Chlamydiota bacterium]